MVIINYGNHQPWRLWITAKFQENYGQDAYAATATCWIQTKYIFYVKSNTFS
jgi:hypothetical protein